jgi:hypothetical protein
MILATSALFASPVAAHVPLPGVADEETKIRSGVIEEYHRGIGDVMFVRDRENKWYRVQLNDGCLAGASYISAAAFRPRDASGRIDRHTQVRLDDGGTVRPCAINSIRRSAAPPQVDSRSPVTLD